MILQRESLKLLLIFRIILETLEMDRECQELSTINNSTEPETACPSSYPGSGMREGTHNARKSY